MYQVHIFLQLFSDVLTFKDTTDPKYIKSIDLNVLTAEDDELGSESEQFDDE